MHLLGFKNSGLVVNATAGADTNFEGLQNNLELDGAVAKIYSLTSITVQTPPWLSFNNSTFVLSRNMPADTISSNITVQATDIYGDTDTATIALNLTTAATPNFSSSIGSLKITAGSSFPFDSSSHIYNKFDITMAAQFTPITSWILFNSQIIIMSGIVPTAAPDSKVTLGTTSESCHASTSQSFGLFVVPGTTRPFISSPSVSLPRPTASAHLAFSGTTIPSSAISHKRLSNGVIVAIVISVFLALSIILALCCY